MGAPERKRSKKLWVSVYCEYSLATRASSVELWGDFGAWLEVWVWARTAIGRANAQRKTNGPQTLAQRLIQSPPEEVSRSDYMRCWSPVQPQIRQWRGFS